MPDYSFKKPADVKNEERKSEGEEKTAADSNLDISIAGIIGGLMALAIAFLSGFLLKKRTTRSD